MTSSMTGFASQECNINGGNLLVELRSVNHRYLEISFKIDENLRNFEPMMRELIQANLGRGKLDCRISLMRDAAAGSVSALNHAVLQQIAEHAKTTAQYFPQSQPINLLQVLQMPGVMQAETLDNDVLEGALNQTLTAALKALIESRRREGAKLKDIVLQRLKAAEEQVAKVKPMMPEIMRQYQEKITSKLNEANASNDDERIRQELVLFAQRIDVDEELSRLTTHFDEVKRIFNTDGLVGKRLDFLMQEMHREANTLGSKSVGIVTTQISMELKVLIEQMREQIQNIE